MGKAVSPDDILDTKLLVRKGIAAAEAGDLELAIDLLSLALALNGDKARSSPKVSRKAISRDQRAFSLRHMADRAVTSDKLSDAEMLTQEGIEAAEAGHLRGHATC